MLVMEAVPPPEESVSSCNSRDRFALDLLLRFIDDHKQLVLAAIKQTNEEQINVKLDQWEFFFHFIYQLDSFSSKGFNKTSNLNAYLQEFTTQYRQSVFRHQLIHYIKFSLATLSLITSGGSIMRSLQCYFVVLLYCRK